MAAGASRAAPARAGGVALVLVASLLAPVQAGASAGGEPWAHAGVPSVIAPPAADSTPLDCADAADPVVLTSSAHLDPACDWTGGVVIRASDVVLDCQGARVYWVGGGRGIEISTPSDVTMSGVVVRNCRVDGFLNGIRVTRDGFRTLPEGGEFEHLLTGVVIEHSEISNTRGVGIFVDGYVSETTIRHSVITGAGSTGIYLETGSRRHLVEGNVVHDNGFRENGPGGQVFELGGLRFRWWGAGREGLAIDGSYENVVRGNHFEGNSHGGVFLYKNCGEYPDSGVWFERRTGADDNVIEGNTFVGGVNGVWVGQRMGENTLPMECTDEAYLVGGVERIVLDFARRNVVRDNRFVDVVYGVRVEDDGTRVEGNHFSGPSAEHHAVIVGTRVRTTALDRPVADTVLVDNRSEIVGNPNPYRWVHGTDGIFVTGNTALGSPVGICEGTELPHALFIWVIDFALEPEGSPVVPPPDDLAIPTVGAFAPCPPSPTPRIAPGAVTVTEGDGVVAAVPVTLSEPSDRTVLAEWRTIDLRLPLVGRPGRDYEPVSGTIELEPGQTQTVVEIPILDDARREWTELVVVGVSSPTNARVGGFFGLGFVVVTDDD